MTCRAFRLREPPMIKAEVVQQRSSSAGLGFGNLAAGRLGRTGGGWHALMTCDLHGLCMLLKSLFTHRAACAGCEGAW